MNPLTKVELEADFLALLGQPTRLRILFFLREGEQCACKITPSMAEDPSVISRHLVKMREAGLLNSRKEGVSIYYQIRNPQVFQVLELIDEMIKNTAQERARQTSAAFIE